MLHKAARTIGTIPFRVAFCTSYMTGVDNWIYEKFPKHYDKVMSYRKKLGEEICNTAGIVRGTTDIDRCLEIGCGTGSVVEGMSEHVRGEIVGIDSSEKMLEVARAKNIENATFQKGDLNNPLDYPEGKFDLVTMYGASRYIEGVGTFHDTIAKLLAPNGCFAVHYGDMGHDRHNWLYSILDEQNYVRKKRAYTREPGMLLGDLTSSNEPVDFYQVQAGTNVAAEDCQPT